MATPRNARPGMLLDPGARINQGLVAWWPMWEGAGGRILDISGKNNHGTLTNGPMWAGGLTFDGVNDYVKSNLSKTAIGNTPSISFRMRPTGAQASIGILQIAEGLNDTNPWILLQRTTSTTIQWYLNANYRITQVVNDNTWCHIVMTYDGITWRAYKNGVDDGTYAGPVGAELGGYTWLGNGYNGYFNGLINGVRIFNRTLSAFEVQQLYVNPNAGLWVPDVIRYYIPAAGGGFQPAWAANSNVLLGGGMAL